MLAVMASVGQCLLVLARVDPGGHGHRSLRVDPRTRLMSWSVLFTKQAQKDARKLASASPALKQKAQVLLDLLAADPYQQPPPYEALVGDLRGACSRRINIQHRLVYQVVNDDHVVKMLRMWSHYD